MSAAFSLHRVTPDNVADAAQGQGVGRFAVDAVLDEGRTRGFKRASVLGEEGDGGPEDFYLRLGFRRTEESVDGEVIGAIDL